MLERMNQKHEEQSMLKRSIDNLEEQEHHPSKQRQRTDEILSTTDSIVHSISQSSGTSDNRQPYAQIMDNRDIDMEDTTIRLSRIPVSEQGLRQYDDPIEYNPPGTLRPKPTLIQAPHPTSSPRKEGKRKETEEEM